MKLGFVTTNDKSLYVSKEDIGLFSLSKEAALNKQQIKPCVPLQLSGNVSTT